MFGIHAVKIKTAFSWIRAMASTMAALLGLVLAMNVSAADTKAKRLLIVGQGPDGHPPTTHEFMAGGRVTAEVVKPYKEIQATIVKADEPWAGGSKLIDEADGIVIWGTQGGAWVEKGAKRDA